MTFGIITEVIGTIGSILGYQRRSGAFIPEWCPVLQQGETHKHMLHSSKTDDQSRTFILNTMIDLQLISMEYINTMGETIISQQERIDALSDFQEKQFKKINKSLKSFSFSGGKDYTDILETTNSKIKELIKKISTLNEAIESRVNDDNSADIAKAISITTKKIEAQESLLKDISKQAKAQSKASQSLTPEVIHENFGKAFKKQDNRIAKELEDLHSKIKELLDEIKIDPSNPKPTELRTEENSKQILKISSQLVPLIESCQKAISESNSLLEKIKKRIE